jgi:hypothetical protein
LIITEISFGVDGTKFIEERMEGAQPCTAHTAHAINQDETCLVIKFLVVERKV